MTIPIETILAAKAGCNQAFEEILASVERIIFKKSRKFKQRGMIDHDDLAQAARLALWQCLQDHDFTIGSLRRQYFDRLCGAMIDEIRRAKGKHDTARGKVKFKRLDKDISGPFLGLQSIEDRDELLHLLRILSTRERECLLLFAAGEKTEDISGTLGVSQKTVYNCIERAFCKLGVAKQEAKRRVGAACKPRPHTKTKTCETCGAEFKMSKGRNSRDFAAARFCSQTCIRYKI